MNAKNLTISTLSITAVILAVALIFLNVAMPQHAVAAGQGGQAASQYVVTTGRLDENREILYVYNTQANIMLVYGFNTDLGAVQPVQAIDMRPLMQIATPDGATPVEPRRPR